MYESLFQGAKVSQIFEDPASKEVSLVYKATEAERNFKEELISNAIESLVISSIQLSEGVLHLFKCRE